MAQPTTDTTQTTVTPLERTGTGISIASLVAFGVPLLVMVYAAITGAKITNQNDITPLFTWATVLTIVAAVLSLIGGGFSIPAVMRGARAGRITTASIAGVVLIASLGYLFFVLLPRENALTNLNNNIVPFGRSIQKYCGDPLQKATDDITVTKNDAQQVGNNTSLFITLMSADAAIFQGDVTKLTDALNSMNTVKAPDAKYQVIIDRCKADLQGQTGYFNDPSTIPLPAPFNAVKPSVSAIDFVKLTASLEAGQLTSLGFSPSSFPLSLVSGFVVQVMQGDLSQTDQKLTDAGNGLKNDIENTLNNSVSPFKIGFPLS